MRLIRRNRRLLVTTVAALLWAVSPVAADERPIVDAHIHYSHDAWPGLAPEKAIAILKEAGLHRALVSSSSDEGTQKLYRLAPDLVIPVLRPYRKRGETGTWMHDQTVTALLADRLSKYRYAGIGEFHVFGKDVDLPVLRAVIGLAKQQGLFLHAHSDADGIDRIFKHDPKARVLWAHAGFDTPDNIRSMLFKYNNLWADLSFRSEHISGEGVAPEWEKLFLEFPDRFMVGTDTYTPERWHEVVEHARLSRSWLNGLPPGVADAIAFKNAERLADWALPKQGNSNGYK